MALIINTNIASLNAQRQLVRSGLDLAQASERLASGRRINTAADDAAGLAISNRMTSQIRGLAQAQRNAMDGISLIQVAEGALDESTNNLQRIRELAIQASNGIYSNADRATLDAEVQQLVFELDRIAETTQFNGQRVLDGTQGKIELQVGANADEIISFSIAEMRTDKLGLNTTSGDLVGAQMQLNGSGGLASDLSFGAVKINGQSLSGFAAGTDLKTVITAINDEISGVTAKAVVSITSPGQGNGVLGVGDSLNVTAKSFDGTSYSFTIANTSSMEEMVDAINSKTGSLITAAIDDKGKLTLSSESMASITLQDSTQGAATGVNETQIADADAAEVIEGITSSWVAEAEARIALYYGLDGGGADIEVNLVNEGAGGSLASVGPTATPGVLELKVDMDDFSATGVPSGGSPPVYMDRIIGHEMVHGAMFATLGTNDAFDAYDLPGWFIEGTAELIHGADERVTGDIGAGYLDNQAEINTAFDGTKALGASPSINGGYSVSYIAVKMLHQEILDAGGTGIIEVMAELKGGSTLDQALNTVGTAHTLGYNSVASFETHFQSGTVAYDFMTNDMNLGDTDTGAIGGGDYIAWGGSAQTAVSIYPNSAAGLPATFDLNLPDEYSGGLMTSTAQLVFESEDGSNIDVRVGAKGTDADLAAFGLQSIASDGTVVGTVLSGNAQNATLGANDLSINGVAIGRVDVNAGLFAKVEAINAATDETGVVASVRAQQSFTLNTTDTVYEAISNAPVSIVNAGNLGFSGVGMVPALGVGDSASDVAAVINNYTSDHGISAYADDSGFLHVFSKNPIIVADSVGGALAGELNFAYPGGTAGSVELNGYEVALADLTDTAAIVANINSATGNTGVVAAIDDNGELELSASSAISVRIGNTQGMESLHRLGISFGILGGENLTDSDTDKRFGDEVFSIGARIKLDAINNNAISIDVTDDGAAATGLTDLNAGLVGGLGASLSSMSVATVSQAQKAIGVVDGALEAINTTRSDLGAINNRLLFTVNNLANTAEKTAAAKSRIVDADYAIETSNLTRAQVMQQASQAMLAQANAQPQSVIQLLNG